MAREYEYSELLQKYKSPIYLYNQEILRNRCTKMREFKDNLEALLPQNVGIDMYYSIKANSNPAILKEVKKCGLKVDCMSPYECYMNEISGFKASEMLYVCNNIDGAEMTMIHSKGILACFDSVSQLRTWGKMFPGTSIMVRINPGVTGVGHSEKVITAGKTTKFGTCEANIQKLLDTAAEYNLHIIGVHQHLGSLFLNDKVPDYIAGVTRFLEIIKDHFKDVQIVDLGGGFGVPYKPDEKELDLSYLVEELSPILTEFVSEYSSVERFAFEPGRYIPCESGKIIGTVTAVKDDNGKVIVGTDIGMNVLVRPSMYDSYHKITLPESSGEETVVTFCGNICESGDILGKDRKVKLPKEGDVVVVHNAGAYGYSMASNYTGRPRPAEVMITMDGERICIRQREMRSNMAALLD